MATHDGDSVGADSATGGGNRKPHQPPPRRYPVARSKNRIPCVQFLSPDHGTRTSKGTTKRILVYFIPGNPGLAGYYTPFLETLRGLLDETYRSSNDDGVDGKLTAGEVEFDLYAQNLLGFDDCDHEVPFGTIQTSESGVAGNEQQESLPFSLEDQICGVWDSLAEIVRDGLHNDASNRGGQTKPERCYDQVILMGHSVGAYIGMEIFHRHHQLALSSRNPQKTTDTTDTKKEVPFNLLADVMLFPTIWDIAQSPNGVKFDRLIRNNAFMSQNAHKIAKWTVDWFPSWVLKSVVRNVMGFSDNGAEVTTNFLTSKDGIHQALYLARDEMGTITEEKWEREMWEAKHDAELLGEREGDRFFFLFGRKDHWVADKTRDAFIEKRKEHGDRGRVRVLVDETGGRDDKPGIPHAFCIHHSEVVAEGVKTWIDEIVGST